MHMSVENSLNLSQTQRIPQGKVVLCNYTVSHSGCSSTCQYNNNIHRMEGTIMCIRKMKRRFVAFYADYTVCSWKAGLRAWRYFFCSAKIKNEKLSIKWNYWLLMYFSISVFLCWELEKELRMEEKDVKTLNGKRRNGKKKPACSLSKSDSVILYSLSILSAAFNHLNFLIIFTRNFWLGEHQVFKQGWALRL